VAGETIDNPEARVVPPVTSKISIELAVTFAGKLNDQVKVLLPPIAAPTSYDVAKALIAKLVNVGGI